MGWANSQLDLSDGIQSSSLPSLLCSFLLSFPLSPLLHWHVCFFNPTPLLPLLFSPSLPSLLTPVCTNFHSNSFSLYSHNHRLLLFPHNSSLSQYIALFSPHLSVSLSPFTFFSLVFFSLTNGTWSLLTHSASYSTSHPRLAPHSLVTHMYSRTHALTVKNAGLHWYIE